MLIAEIHGKRFLEAEGQEDWLTSAVFGHLRHIPPRVFWPDLFERAHTVGDGVSLNFRIRSAGIDLAQYSKLEIHFWQFCEGYGEPDLILRFSGGEQSPLIVVVEVKLDSGKSGVGQNDQLRRYLELLDNPVALQVPSSERVHRYLVYLTRAFSKLEIEESVRLAEEAGMNDARDRLFGLQWQDVLESAAARSQVDGLLGEVAQFLRARGFEAFRGFRSPPPELKPVSGAFYGAEYFTSQDAQLDFGIGGKFYGH